MDASYWISVYTITFSDFTRMLIILTLLQTKSHTKKGMMEAEN